MTGLDLLYRTRREFNDHISNKPAISGLPGFDVGAHVSSFSWWLLEKERLERAISILEDLYDPASKTKRLASERRRRMWMEKHYPGDES